MGPRKSWTLIIVSFGLFMTALDNLVVATALPVIRADLGARLADLEWTVNGYNLSFACLLLTGAALGDRFGRRRMFAIGLLVFTAASAAAACSPGVGMLITARVVQGAGAAIVMPLTLTLISEAFPKEKRGAAIGLWGGITGLGVAAGPLVGGAIAEGGDWRWIFWINVPIGLVLAPLGLRCLTESYGPRPHLDLPGLALAASGFFGLTWGLVRGGTVGWGSAEVVTAFAAGALLLLAFVRWQQRARTPMLPLGLFRSRTFSTANGVAFFSFASLFGALFVIAQFLQLALGYTPLEAGVRMLPWAGAPMIVAPIAGALADRYGNRPFMAAGLALQAVGYAWVAAIAAPGMGYGWLGAALTLSGIGISMCFPTVANAVMGSVPLPEAGVASGTNSAVRELGGVFGVALVAAVFTANGGYGTPQHFTDGLVPAVWVAAALSAAGVVAALFAPVRPEEHPAAPADPRPLEHTGALPGASV
ncbi:MFS transporter [Streptomyces sp. NBC_01465]|uniref:MFS transporter n=1 Tax=Streptomyces sp. NBC_01465 TaxID=2903878 RepID=UPI002E359D60|nr:MFS transporter [Streptomyces sp. NBC_01465]